MPLEGRIMVKIESGSFSRTSSLSKPKKAANTSSSFTDKVAHSAQNATIESKTEADKIAGIQAPDGIFQIQELSDALGSRRKTILRGEALLASLDHIKHQLLEGRITPQSLKNLKNLVEDSHTGSIDPELEAVLKEIELRVQVELAKLEQISNS